MTILFCRIGMMFRYQGITGDDQISGGGAYIDINQTGHEICNFLEHEEALFGYVEPPGQETATGKRININNLGASNSDQSISGITVVWTSTRQSFGNVIVGWYRDATVFREFQEFTVTPPIHQRNDLRGYRISALANQSRLLSPEERTFVVQGMGQANLWYARLPKGVALVQKVEAYINEHS